MDGWDFLKTAEHLSSSSQEHDLRSSISRSYYAAFHELARALESSGMRLKKGAAGHGELFNWLTGCDIQPLKKAGQKLGSLRTKRNQADYHMHRSAEEFSQNNALLALGEARQAKQAFASVPVAEAVRAIDKYLDRIGQSRR